MTAKFPTLTVRAGREKPVRNRHPWIFSGAVAKCDQVTGGALVDIRDTGGRFLARGYANPKSKIVGRVICWDEAEHIDQAFWQRRLAAAVSRRRHYLDDPANTACRLVMSEADQLAGLIVDKYGDYLVVQALTAGIDAQLPAITEALIATVAPRGIWERSDDAVRELEGLPKTARLLHGEEPPAAGVLIRENGLSFLVDLREGHKTGFYLDQRRNHLLLRAHCAGKRVLDAFCYTGGFTLNAGFAGASSVVSLDASEPALTRLRHNLVASGLAKDSTSATTGRFSQKMGNAFETLRELRDLGETFDVVVLDPPKFAASGAQVDKAARGYKDINMLALKLLNPGGILATFSCSGHISADLFQKIIFGAAIDAGRDAQIIDFLTQADDHPVLLSFPESFYLKGLLCRTL